MPLYSRYFTPRHDPGLAENAQAYCLYLDSPSLSGTTEAPLILAQNTTSGATAKQMIVYGRRLQARSVYEATLRFYTAPTSPVAGSAATPINRKLGGAASAMTLTTGPTAGANGTLVDAVSNMAYAASELNDSPIIVPAGGVLLVTLTASNTSAKVLVGLDWVEVP